MRKRFNKVICACLAASMVFSSPMTLGQKEQVQAATAGSEKVVDVTETTTLDDTTEATGWLTNWSDYYRLSGDIEMTYDIEGSTKGTNNWNAPCVILSTDYDRGTTGYSEYVVLRADNYGWGNNYANTVMTRSSVNWEEWQSIAKSYTGTIYVQKKGTTVTIEETYTSKTNTSLTHIQKYVVPDVTGDKVRFFFCPDTATMKISKVTVSTVDTSELRTAIEKADAIYDADYTTGVLNNLKTALATAKDALSSTDQDEIDNATQALNTALDNINTTTALENSLIGCYDFNGNITNLISKEDSTPVVISDGSVTDDKSVSPTYSDEGIVLGSYGLKLPNKFNDLNNYTISLKAKFNSTALNALDKAIYCIQKPAAWSVSREVLYTGWDTNTPALLSEVGSTKTTWNWAGTSSVGLEADTTYDIVVRKESNKTNIYVNGALVASATNAKTGSFGEDASVLLGANSWGLTNMTVYDCQIYNRTLSTTEIAALKNTSAEKNYVNYVKTTESCDNFYDISSYRSGETYTAPTKTGKVFAGWYEDAEFTTPIGKDVKTGYAYAKFVDETLLYPKCQTRAGTTAESESADLRMMLAVDSLDYSNVGFDIVYNDTNYYGQSKTVYEQIQVTDNGVPCSFAPAVVFETEVAKYMLSCILTDIPQTDFNKKICVTPYWTTLDGTKVTGTDRDVAISDSFGA